MPEISRPRAVGPPRPSPQLAGRLDTPCAEKTAEEQTQRLLRCCNINYFLLICDLEAFPKPAEDPGSHSVPWMVRYHPLVLPDEGGAQAACARADSLPCGQKTEAALWTCFCLPHSLLPAGQGAHLAETQASCFLGSRGQGWGENVTLGARPFLLVGGSRQA